MKHKGSFLWTIALLIATCLASCSHNEENSINEYQYQTLEKSIPELSLFINSEDAKVTAINFLNLDEEKPQISIEDIEELLTVENEQEQPILYVINLKEDKGFTVVSASTVETPILAYADTGKFNLENIEEHDGVNDWTAKKFVKIDYLINNPQEIDTDVIYQWVALNPALDTQTVGTPNAMTVQTISHFNYGPWLSTTWGQSYSTNIVAYNNYVRFNNCPQGTTPTGCVAVAMAQIMKFHNKPALTNTMPNYVNSSNYTTTGADNIAKFMQTIGQTVNMNYSCSASGASSNNAAIALYYYFGYSVSGVSDINKNTIANEILNSRPVYLDGCAERKIKSTPKKTGLFRFTIGKTTYSYDRCHAWVADGLSGKILKVKYWVMTKYIALPDYIYMNWGWRGTYNGWYDYDNWGDEMHGNYSPNYQYKQHMIYNIKPR